MGKLVFEEPVFEKSVFEKSAGMLFILSFPDNIFPILSSPGNIVNKPSVLQNFNISFGAVDDDFIAVF